MKLTKFLFENDELKSSGNKVVTIKEAAKINPAFWKRLVEETENCIGYEVDNKLVNSFGTGDDDAHVLTIEERKKVKNTLSKMLLNKCIITPRGVAYFDDNINNVVFFDNAAGARDCLYENDDVTEVWGMTKEELESLSVK